MPRSTALSLLAAAVGLALFFFYNLDANPHPDRQAYISVAVASFNTAAIVLLFVILYRSERASAEEFGRTLRDNIGTIVVALLISFIYSAYDLASAFR